MLIFSAIVVGAVGILLSALFRTKSWKRELFEGIMTTMRACLILYTVGVLIGTWIHSASCLP